MKSEHGRRRNVLLSQWPKPSTERILQSLGRKASNPSSKFQQSKLLFEMKKMQYDLGDPENKTMDANTLRHTGGDFITQVQNLMTLSGERLQEVERFVKLNRHMVKEQSKTHPHNTLLNFERRKNITNQAMARLESLPNIHSCSNNARKSLTHGIEQSSKVKNPFKFELIFDGKNITVTSFEMNMKPNIYTLPDFFEKLELFYNKFSEVTNHDPAVLTESFKLLVGFDQNSHRDIIERVFFGSKKFIRKSISKQLLMNFLAERQNLCNPSKMVSRFIRSYKDKIALRSKMSLIETNKLGTKPPNNDKDLMRKASLYDSSGQQKAQFGPRGSNLSLKQNESTSSMNFEIEFLRVMYFILNRLLNHFFKTKFRNIQKLSNASSEVSLRLMRLTRFDFGFNPFLDPQQATRFAQRCDQVERDQQGVIRALGRNSVTKSLTKHRYLSQDNAVAYLKNIRKYA
jgi:hypothetical protein